MVTTGLYIIDPRLREPILKSAKGITGCAAIMWQVGWAIVNPLIYSYKIYACVSRRGSSTQSITERAAMISSSRRDRICLVLNALMWRTVTYASEVAWSGVVGSLNTLAAAMRRVLRKNRFMRPYISDNSRR
jgi:hypothetical protein